MGKSHVQVFVRTRPVARSFEGLKTHKDGDTITLTFPKDEASGLINNQLESLTLKYDGVLENVSQETVYNTCVHDAVDSVLAGYNATVFCYGQTGAGKTFTMSGDAHNYAHRGVIPRALHHIFREIDLRTDKTYKVHVSYMEIHNETLYDLLSDNPAASDSLSILDDASNTVVRGLTKAEVRSEEEALAQFFLGEQGRSTAVHVLNNNSSRSHVLFSVFVETRTSAEARERALLSKLHLVDLAGSERTKKTNASGDQLREASCINKSLTFLEQVVNALARKDAHVPFRQTKLTAALRDALGGNCKTVMIANLWPEAVHLEESASTLRFASRVRCLETSAVVNESSDPGLALARAERQIKELKQELAMRDMLSGRGRIVYEDLSEGEQLELQQLVLRYLSGTAELDQLPVESLKRIKETYKAFKAVAGSWAAQAGQGAQGVAASSADAGVGRMSGSDPIGVGDVDLAASAGFCVGTAPTQARPVMALTQTAADLSTSGRNPRSNSPGKTAQPSPRGTLLQQQQQQQQQQQTGSPLAQQQQRQESDRLGLSATAASGLSPRTAGTDNDSSGLDASDRNALFSKYKHSVSEGRQQSEQVRLQQQQVNDLKQQIKDVGSQVNNFKTEIDSLSSQLESRKAAASPAVAAPSSSGSGSTRSSSNGEVLDNEQYMLTQQLKAAKAKYRTAFDLLKDLRSGLEPAIDSLAAAKEALLVGYDTWISSGGKQLDNSQQIAAWRGGLDDEYSEQLDPTEAFEKMDLARKATAAGDPDSAAYFAARKQTSKLLGGRPVAAPTRKL